MSIKKNWIAILSFATGILVIAVFVQYSQIKHLNSRIDTANETIYRIATNDSLISQDIKMMQIKEDMYIKQQDRDTNLILVVFTISFLLFSLITYGSFAKRVDNIEREIESKNSKYIQTLRLLKMKLIGALGAINKDRADEYLTKKSFSKYITFQLRYLSNLVEVSKTLIDTREMDSSVYDDIVSKIASGITDIVLFFEQMIKEDMEITVDREVFNHYLDELRTIKDSNLNELVSKLESLIKKENLQLKVKS